MVAEDAVVRPDGATWAFQPGTVYSLKLARSSPTETEWALQSGQEWNGTKLRFQHERE